MCALGRQLAPHGVRINSVLLAGGELTARHSSASDAAEVSLSSDASLEVQSCRAYPQPHSGDCTYMSPHGAD